MVPPNFPTSPASKIASMHIASDVNGGTIVLNPLIVQYAGIIKVEPIVSILSAKTEPNGGPSGKIKPNQKAITKAGCPATCADNPRNRSMNKIAKKYPSVIGFPFGLRWEIHITSGLSKKNKVVK